MARKPKFERILKVLNREQPDCVPFYEHFADVKTIETYLNRPCPNLKEGVDGKIPFMQFYVDFYHKLGFDCLPFEIGLNLFHLGGFFGGGRGWVDHEVATISNMEEFKEYPWPTPEEAFNFELLEAASKILPQGMGLVCGVAGGVQEHVLSLIGLKRFSIAVKKEPSFIAAMFKQIGGLIREIDKIIAEKDYVGALRMGDDMGYKTGTLLNPKTVKDYVLPQHKQIVAEAHKQHKPFILHSCGNLTDIIDDLISEVRIDGWHSFQDLILPVTEAKLKYGDRVALLGGVDLDKLCRSSLPDLEQYCKNLIETCKKGGGFAFGTGNSVADYIPLENYIQMLKYGEKYGSY